MKWEGRKGRKHELCGEGDRGEVPIRDVQLWVVCVGGGGGGGGTDVSGVVVGGKGLMCRGWWGEGRDRCGMGRGLNSDRHKRPTHTKG